MQKKPKTRVKDDYMKRAKSRLKTVKKGNDNGIGEGKTRAKQGRHQDNDVTRKKDKGKNKGTDKVKARNNGKTGVEVRALQWYSKFKKKYKGKNKWKEKGKGIEMGRREDWEKKENKCRKDSR